MASINKVLLVGHMCADPKLSYLPSGSAVAEFSVATNEKFKDRDGNVKETVEFHKVKVFGRSAEFCGNYLTKGRLVYVEGKLTTRSWEDQQGQKRYITEVVVSAPGHTIQGLDKGQAQGQQEQRQTTPQQQRQASRQPASQERERFPSEVSGLDEVPFAIILAPLMAFAIASMQGGLFL